MCTHVFNTFRYFYNQKLSYKICDFSLFSAQAILLETMSETDYYRKTTKTNNTFF